MGRLRFERNELGLALFKEGRSVPLGYTRGDRLRMKCGDDYEEFTPEDFESMARELREHSKQSERRGRATTWRVHAGR